MGARGVNGGDYVRPATLLTLDEIARALGGTLHGTPVSVCGVSTDSRQICAGDLFVALVGERFDGHRFVEQSMRRGAAAALVSRPVSADVPLPQVVVPDTRLALGKLAGFWRARFATPLVALTGSNGKTTVKEMTAAILAAYCGERDEILATEGNLNNDIGMPLTLLRLREHHRYAVIEMGMNHAGEIDYLTRIAKPDVALVNNAHRAHVGLLGSVEAVARAKGEIYAGLPADGIALVNADEPFAQAWRALNTGRRIVTFGLSPAADVHASFEGAQARFVTPVDAFVATLQVSGMHNLRNAVAACAIAHALEIPPHAMQSGLAAFTGVPGRLQRRAAMNGATLIDDSYNANPESMKAAVDVLASEGGRRILVMGDMGELGEAAAAMHAEVGVYARERGVDALLALGNDSARAVEAFGPDARHFPDTDALLEAARRECRTGTTLLVKGSRFMQMERVADALAVTGGTHAA
jgi:UDP-N-acetylmuramoyl-tripeptide--D-alanyl-D-alanine ligase